MERLDLFLISCDFDLSAFTLIHQESMLRLMMPPLLQAMSKSVKEFKSLTAE